MIRLPTILEFTKRIEEIKSNMECSKNFECLTSRITNLPKVRDVGCASFVETLGKHPFHCQFLISYGKSKYCACPLRVYVVQNLKK